MLVFIVWIIAWLLVDFIDIKIAKVPRFKYSLPLTLFIIWLSFSWGCKYLFAFKGVKKYMAIYSLSLIMTIAWFIVGSFSVIKFHLLIGGQL